MAFKFCLKTGTFVLPLLLVVFFLSAGRRFPAANPTHPRETEPAEQISLQQFQSAQNALIKGKWLYIRRTVKKHLTRAKEELNNAIETFPQLADAHYYLSLLYVQEGNDQQALVHVRKAIENFKVMETVYQFIKQKNPQLLDREYVDYGKKNLARYFELQGNIFRKKKNTMKPVPNTLWHYIKTRI